MIVSQQRTDPRTTLDNERAEILRGLHFLFELGELFEVRILGTGGNSKRIDAGYFDDPDVAADWILRYRKKAIGIYVTLNRPDPALKARSYNRIKDWAKDLTSDKHIT